LHFYEIPGVGRSACAPRYTNKPKSDRIEKKKILNLFEQQQTKNGPFTMSAYHCAPDHLHSGRVPKRGTHCIPNSHFNARTQLVRTVSAPRVPMVHISSQPS
jgi:hypothetical protein